MRTNIRFRWNDASKNFIENGLPAFFEGVSSHIGRSAIQASSDLFFERVTSLVPEFEGELGTIGFWGVTTKGTPEGLSWYFGEIPDYPFHIVDDSRKYDRFSYAAGKHKGIAAESHRVWLYASDTKARKKLRRWVRANLVSNLPETEEEAEELRNEGHDIPMIIEVDPGESATEYLISSSMVSLLADIIVEKFELNTRHILGREWGELI